ncbi:MAG: GH92 family glycosyl hydrolase [Bacteroidales bacterium]|nr:GH92 family glycosyl hydrolase [Bacteroidales bacterium]
MLPLLLTLLLAVLPGPAPERTRYVNPFVGTDAHGHTFPGAVAPFGMVQLSPDTRPQAGDWDGCSGYHYSDGVIYGFSHTHLSGTGCDDLCDILLMPGTQPSTFSHEREKAAPGYYEVFLDGPQVQVRLTAGRRVGVHEYSFPAGTQPQVTLDLRHRDPLDAWRITPQGRNALSGWRQSSSWARGQDVYFWMEFSAPVRCKLQDGGRKALLRFPRGERTVTVRVGISSVSEENARQNLLAEYPASFEGQRAATQAAWEEYLGKLDCPWDDEEHLRRFYTALYHTGIHPSLYSDANGEYRGMDRQVHRADGWERYSILSLWDTFRGEHPLLWEIEPARSYDFLKTFLSIYDEAGKLPVWELWGYETNCMIGYNAAPVIADALARGFTDFDVEKALEALVASSRRPEFGLDSFRKNGLVLADDEHESVSKTLEYAYDDWCTAQVAKYLGRTELYEEYMRSAQYWRNVFDPETGFMRARLDGRRLTPFDPREVNNHYTEANAWQYSLFVPHDIAGLIEALGGPEALERRLDEMFEAEEGNTGRTQADITGTIGQYAHGNEPSHHVAYLYDFAGRPDKRQARVDQILETLYSSAPDGLCGNDDCGQMSAWYVLSALGRYPVCPGQTDDLITRIPKTLVTNPAFEVENTIFTDSLQVALSGEGEIFFRIGEGEFRPYRGPFTVYEPCTMEAFAQAGERRSFTTRCTVHQIARDRDIEIRARYSRQYTAGGDEGLIDGRRGGLNWRTGGWQGYQDTDFEAVVDLRSVRSVRTVGAGFCQDARSWIWMPRWVEFSVSQDGKDFTPLARVENTVDERDYEIRIWNCEVPADVQARYVKVRAANIGTIPEWHPGAGSPGFIFIDEIWIK